MRSFVFFVFLLLFSQAALSASASILNFTEGDFIRLQPVAFDADGDRLTYQFRPPLSAKGEWQTTYGDAGSYLSQIQVSDRKSTVIQNLTLVIFKKEELPTIDASAPEKREFYLQEGDSTLFMVRASDLNKDPIVITWKIDDEVVGQGTSYLYQPDYYSEGRHAITAEVSDGFNVVPVNWYIDVGDVDRAALLDDVEDVEVKEGEEVILPLKDFKAYDLKHSISAPMGDDGRWLTTYDDAGKYRVNITLFDDKEFTFTKRIRVVVENVDRAPQLLTPSAFSGREGEELVAPIAFNDPDGQELDITAQIPEGASFNGSAVFWTPGYDVVSRDSFTEEVKRRYHLLDAPITFNVTVTDGELTLIQPITFRIFNTNRAPVLTDAPDVTVNQGEPVAIAYTASDEDGDELSASLEGSIQQGQIAREAGIYHARLVVSDGLNTAEKQVRVTVLAPEPTRVLKALPPLSVAEGGRLVVGLEADWAESFTVNPLPEGAFLSGNLLVWEPDGKAVSRDTQLNLTFTARDGEGHEASQQTTLLVKNVNTLPVLLSSSSQDGKSFGVGQELLFVVRAEDTDGDALSYAWAVNSKSVEASGNSVTLSFPSAGKKRISAVVSDGTKSVTRSWEITIARGPIVKLVPATQQKPASTTTQSVKALSQPLVLPEHETIRFVVVHKGDSAPLPSPAKNSNTLSFEVE